jgi:P-type E1-E2 ATPase
MTIKIDIPGWRQLELAVLVLDVNGTLALDGYLLPGVEDRLQILRSQLDVYLLSADTYGELGRTAKRLGVSATRLRAGEDESGQKTSFVKKLRTDAVVAIGNGMNDVGMLAEAALGIAVLEHEGIALQALLASDIVVSSIDDALDLLLHPKRLLASLRR